MTARLDHITRRRYTGPYPPYKVDRKQASVNGGIDLAPQVMDPNHAPLQDYQRHLEYRPGPKQDDDTTPLTSPVAPAPSPHTRERALVSAPATTGKPEATAPETTVEQAPKSPRSRVEPTPIATSAQLKMNPTTPTIDTKMLGHLPTLLSDGTNYGIRKQILQGIAIINNVEAALDETSPPPSVTSPHHPIYRRKCAFLRMSILTSLLSDLVGTIDLEPNVTPRQLVAEIKDHFTDSTTTTHLTL